MRELESYSIDELEALTGYDRRTISYYIAEGLLPKVGRRGRNTRYGREFVDRLKFIQRVKELQDAGKLPSATLADIGAIIARLSATDIVEAGKSNKRLLQLFAEELGGAGDVESSEMSRLDPEEGVATTLDSIAYCIAQPDPDEFDAVTPAESRLPPASERRKRMIRRSPRDPRPVEDAHEPQFSASSETAMRLRAETHAMHEQTAHEMDELRAMREELLDTFREAQRFTKELMNELRRTRELRRDLEEELKQIHELRSKALLAAARGKRDD